MRFWQLYSFQEAYYGNQDVLFVLCDNPDEVFSPSQENYQTDIFLFDKIKQDLNIDELSFAIDELTFEVNSSAIHTEIDRNALAFALDATNSSIIRYTAIFFGQNPELSNLLFFGRLSNKIKAEDLAWNRIDYQENFEPQRRWSFVSYSFDISILKEVLLLGDMYRMVNGEKVRIPSIIERWRADNLQAFRQIFTHRLFHWKDLPDLQYAFFTPLGNLWKILQKCLDFATEILYELYNLSISFSLLPSQLGFSLCPAYFYRDNALIFGKSFESWRIEISGNPVKIGILPDDYLDDSTSSLFIDIRMLDPFVFAQSQDEIDFANSDLQSSFLRNNSIADLLFDIAQSLGCFVRFTQTGPSSFNVQFFPRNSFLSDKTYIISPQKASIEIDSASSSSSIRFFSVANRFANDFFDIFTNEEISSNLQEKLNQQNNEKKLYNIDFQSLLFSISPTLHFHYDSSCQTLVPLNCRYSDSYAESFDLLSYFPPCGQQPKKIFLHKALYIRCYAPEPEVRSHSPFDLIPIIRPAALLLANIDGSNRYFTSLSDYINEIYARDRQFYLSTYEMSFPFWNNFSKNSNGNNPSWKNLYLGALISLSEPILRYINGQFQLGLNSRDYVVVSLERSLKSPETRFRLHSASRFAFGWWDSPQIPNFSSPSFALPPPHTKKISYYKIAQGENISPGSAVRITSVGEIALATPYHSYRFSTIGIALSSGQGGDIIPVQTEGIVECDLYSFSDIGSFVFLRLGNPLNISQSLLDFPTGSEDLVVILGKALSSNSFLLDIQEFSLELLGEPS